MHIDCPECGRRVTLEANNIVPYHDNAPPLRSLCRASKEDATPVVTIIERARAEEREACAVLLEESARALDTIAAGLVAGSVLRLDLEKAAAVLRTTTGEIRTRGQNGGAR